MSDFVQTMKDWRRMCAAYSTDDDDCCNGCPVLDYRDHGCSAIFEMDVVDWKKYENAIAKWAAEHPEPVYPTWGEWFVEKGILPDGYYHATNDLYLLNILEKAMQTQISADTAQKLGVKPKEQEAR